MKTRVGLIPNSNCETRKIKTRTRHVQTKNSTRNNYKEFFFKKQGDDKKTYPKINFEHIEGNR